MVDLSPNTQNTGSGATVLELINHRNERWRERNNIVYLRKTGESGGVPDDFVERYRDAQIREAMEQYQPEDVINEDETGVFGTSFQMGPLPTEVPMIMETNSRSLHYS